VQLAGSEGVTGMDARVSVANYIGISSIRFLSICFFSICFFRPKMAGVTLLTG
jgi:hypothetical protein